MHGVVVVLSAEEIRQRRAELLARLSVPWDQARRLAAVYALDAADLNIYYTVRALDRL